jgi:hypothetical protein
MRPVTGTWSWVVAESEAQAVEPTAITVTNDTDTVDADTSSVEALRANPGADGISLREAIEVTNNDPGAYAVAFTPALSGKTITLGEYLPPLTGGGVSLEGDIDGDGAPDVTVVTTLQEEWSRAIWIASSGNRLHGLTLKGFAVGVWLDPATGDELPTHRTLADNVISGLAILGIRMDGIMFHSPASPDCGLPKPDPCRTYITFADTTITGNTIETIPARGAGINMQISSSGDRIAGATVTDNTIRLGGGAGIDLGQTGNAGDDGTSARISDVLIARNAIEGTGMVGIEVAAGTSRAQGNITEAVRVLDNRVHLVCRGSGTCNGISILAGTDASYAIAPDVHPVRHPDGNVLRNVEVAGNRLSGDLEVGVWVGAGSGGAAGSRNRVLDLQIERNVISSTIVGKGVYLAVGAADPDLHRYAAGNQITGVQIGENRISIGRTRPPGFSRWNLDVGGGIVLVGGDDFSRDGRIRDIRVAKNEIKVAFEAVHGGIKLIGGIGSTARGNRVTCVRLSANRVSGTRPAVSVRSNIDARTNYASLGGC